MLDLGRLISGEVFEATYTGADGKEVSLFFEHPTPGQKGAALKIAGLTNPERMAGADVLLANDQANFALARMCVTRVKGVVQSAVFRESNEFGYDHLSPELLEKLERLPLIRLGRYLFEASEPSAEEGKG